MSDSSVDVIADHVYLRGWCRRVLEALGLPGADAGVAADCLTEADLAGIETHGLMRLPGYAGRLKSGGDNARPDIRVLRENGATALLDGDGGMGQVCATRAMERAICKAEACGVGVVSIRNCGHFGAAGHYASLASDRGLIGAALTNVMASMPPTGGAARRLGNNAYALAFPAGEEPPLIIDATTSKASWGRVFLCRQRGEALPEGCYLDREGRPTVCPDAVIDGGALLPAGGHKGYGLAVAIEMLTGILAGAPVDASVRHDAGTERRSKGYSFLMAALRIDCFGDPAVFRADTDAWVRHIRSTPRAAGGEGVRLPGERRFATRALRLVAGVPLSGATAGQLRILGDELNVPFDPAGSLG